MSHIMDKVLQPTHLHLVVRRIDLVVWMELLDADAPASCRVRPADDALLDDARGAGGAMQSCRQPTNSASRRQPTH